MEKSAIIARISFRSQDQKEEVQNKIMGRSVPVLEKASSYYKIQVDSFPALNALAKELPRAAVVEIIKEIETLPKCF